MFSTFFQSIPSGLFEVFAVGALLGIAALFYRRRRNLRGRLFLFLSLAIVVMIVWRVGIQILSDRYAAILIVPAIGFTVYFIFEFGKILQEWISFPEKWNRIMPSLILPGVTIACLVQLAHFNPYAGQLLDGCAALQKDFENVPGALVWSSFREARRIHYYSGLPTVPYPETPGDIDDAILFRNLRNYRKAESVLYLDLQLPSTRPDLTPHEIGLPENADWTRLFSSFTNSKRKKKHQIYRYRPPVKIVKGSDVSSIRSGPNLLPGGGMNQFRSASSSSLLLKNLAKQYEFYRAPGQLLPAEAVFLVPPNCSPETVPKMRMVTNADGDGTSALVFQTGQIPGTLSFHHAFEKGKYSASIRVQGTPGTHLMLMMNVRSNQKELGNFFVAEHVLSSESPMELIGTIFPEDFREDGILFFPLLLVKDGTVSLMEFKINKLL